MLLNTRTARERNRARNGGNEQGAAITVGGHEAQVERLYKRARDLKIRGQREYCTERERERERE